MSQFESTAEEVILDSIQNMGGRKKPTTNGVMICCPFHGDKTPSFGINLSTSTGVPLGYGHCLGCGKKASWNEIAEQLGLPKLKKSDFKVTSYKQRTRQHLLMKRSSLKDIVFKEFRCSEYIQKWEPTRIWRTIQGDLMNKFAFKAFDIEKAKEFAILPVMVEGELVGAIKAVVKKTEDPNELSYVTSKADNRNSWVKKSGLFPYDVVVDMLEQTGLRTVVLVEGPRDALWLIQNGIPALAILGSQAWSPSKMKRLLSLPIERVILCMDGDRAGKSATDFIMKTMSKKTELIDFDLYGLAQRKGLDKIDPAMLKSGGKTINRLRKLLELES